ncbi:hypothetical protein HGRIS_008200 [Hohenbuehelia grisea]|uniref:Cerato-platanin n=1 Tax=Hohenbuehelia grisea TaxID=104357 RepID=A0ABR3J794_9AGAR
MKFSALFTPIALLAGFASAALPINLYYDEKLDDKSILMKNTSCASTQLAEKYPDFGSIPTRLASASVHLMGWNTDKCGSCWQIEYTDRQGEKHSLHALAVNTEGGRPMGTAFIKVGLSTMNELTRGRGRELIRVDAEAHEIHPQACLHRRP